jgi:hypothetical protein
MDVERIQKINALALELMKSGLAGDREDAVIQAEKIYRSRDPQEPYKVMRETMQEVKADAGRSNTNQSSEMTDDKVKDILEKNTNFMVAKIKEFQDKITALENQIGSLRTQMSYQKPQPTQDVRQMPQSSPQQPMRGESSTSSTHPRSGGYNSSEVSIEKFFYMGSK